MPTYPKLRESILQGASVADGMEETYWDGEIRGLGVRVRCFGEQVSRTWVIKYRNAAGAQRKLTLGDWPGLTVAKARLLAKKQIGRIADKADPVREKAQTREAGTVALLLARFLKDHVKGKKRSETTAKEYERLINKVINPSLGSAQVAAIDRADVERWFSKLSETPRQANQALAVLSKACNLAEGWRLRPTSSNPCRGIERYPEKQRDRVPTAEDYPAIGRELAALEEAGSIGSSAADVIRVLALTGLRLSEARSIRWRNINTKSGVITLDRVKSGKLESKSRVVGAASLAILAAQPRPNADDSSDDDFVFPAAEQDAPLSIWTIESAWKRVRKAAGLNDLRLHDLRHGVGTLAASMGANAFLVRDKLGHATLAMTNRYVGKQSNPLTALSEKIETHISAAMGATESRTVRLVGRKSKKSISI